MRLVGQIGSLGFALWAMSSTLGAQVHGGHAPGFGTLGGARPQSPTLSGFGSLRPSPTHPDRQGINGMDVRMPAGRGYSIPGFVSPAGRAARPWGYPYAAGRTLTAPVTVPVPVPVPYYVPVPTPPATSTNLAMPAEPPPRYDPTRSRMTVIGSGADGGGGVMRVERQSNRAVRLTWLASERPVREATLFVADADQRPLAVRGVDLLHRQATFTLTDWGRVAYAGLTVIFTDGATRTTLVPFLAAVEAGTAK